MRNTRKFAIVRRVGNKNKILKGDVMVKLENMSKRDKIKNIIFRGLGGVWSGSQETFELIVDNIYEKLKNVPDDYNELLMAYIRL